MLLLVGMGYGGGAGEGIEVGESREGGVQSKDEMKEADSDRLNKEGCGGTKEVECDQHSVHSSFSLPFTSFPCIGENVQYYWCSEANIEDHNFEKTQLKLEN